MAYLPHDGVPPRSTVYNIFRKFQREGVWDAIWAELYTALREPPGREASSTAGVIDSQTLKSAEKRGVQENAVAYDRGKKLKGRKLHTLVDTEGLPLQVVVHSAGIQDRDGAALVLDKIRRRFPWLELIWADGRYNSRQVSEADAKQLGLHMDSVKRSDDMKGFVVLPRRSVVERTFLWFGRNRLLAKDFEILAETLSAFVLLAAIQLGVGRLARA